MSTPPSYLMIGRGGGAMTVSLGFNAVKGAGWLIRVDFARSAHAGTSGNLRAGECAWADRPLNAQEPACLYLSSSTRWHPTNLRFEAKTRRLTQLEFEGDADPARQLFTWATTEGHLFYVHAFNPPWATGVLLVTKVGP